MKGTNKIEVNAGTLMEMAEEYFNRRLLSGHQVKVTNVDVSNCAGVPSTRLTVIDEEASDDE